MAVLDLHARIMALSDETLDRGWTLSLETVFTSRAEHGQFVHWRRAPFDHPANWKL